MPSSLQNLLRKLQWSDFGTPQKKPAPGAGQSAVAAHTATTHKPFNWSLLPVSGSKPTVYKLADNINVTIEFVSGKSWVADWVFTRPKQFQDDLLNHEQGHYEITALSARDMFIELMQLKQLTFKSSAEGAAAIAAITSRFTEAKIQPIHQKYDAVAETNHGANATAQQQWDAFFNTAFTKPRVPSLLAPDGTLYKVPLLDVLRSSGKAP